MTDNTCSICLDPLLSETGEKSIGTAVPCGHCFHTKCFARWKASRRTRIRVPCPNCNKATDDFIRLFISTNVLDMQCLPVSSEEDLVPKYRKSPPVVVMPSPPRLLSSPSRNAQDPPSGTSRSTSAVARMRSSRNDTTTSSSSTVANNPTTTRRTSRLSPFRTARVQDNTTSANQTVPVVLNRRRHSSRSLSRMLQLSKAVKDLKVAQQSIAKQVQDHRAMIFTLGTCRQDQQTKRICKLRTSQFQLSTDIEDHEASLEALPMDSLRRRDYRRVEEMLQELETKTSVHREQAELVNTLYTTRLEQERSRVARIRDEQRQLTETLRDYGAAIKALGSHHSAGIRLRGRKQRHLVHKVGALGDAIQSINLNTLERDHVKKMKHVEDELISLVQRVGDHGASLQSLCSVHHFLVTSASADHEC